MTDQDRTISPAIAPYIERVAQAICTGLYPEAAAKGRTWPDFPAATRQHLRCVAQNVLVALEAAVLQPFEQVITACMLNQLIDLGAQASAAHTQSHSDDGAAGTEAAVRFFQLRERMRALLAPSGAPQDGTREAAALHRIVEEADRRPFNPIGNVIEHVVPEARIALAAGREGDV